jgi:anti-sigma factor RsiW
MTTTIGYDPFDPAAWAGAPGCGAFEIALDMRAQGALAAAAVEVLEAHLAACESCRAYAASVGRVQAALRVAPALPPSWEVVQARVQAEVKAYRRAPWITIAAMLGALGSIVGITKLAGARPPSLVELALVFAFALFLYVIVHVRSRRRLRGLLDARDVVASYRAQLEDGVRQTRRTLPLLFATVGLLLLQLVAIVAGSTRVTPEVRFAFGANVVATLLSLFNLVTMPRRIRAMRRELAELK